MGHARNSIIVHTADVLIAIGGGYGTLSEIALALKIGKAVVALQPPYQIPGVITAQTPLGAVDEALTLVELGRKPQILGQPVHLSSPRALRSINLDYARA